MSSTCKIGSTVLASHFAELDGSIQCSSCYTIGELDAIDEGEGACQYYVNGQWWEYAREIDTSSVKLEFDSISDSDVENHPAYKIVMEEVLKEALNTASSVRIAKNDIGEWLSNL